MNRGRGPKYTVPCPKGRPRRTRRQGEDAERRRAQKDISGPAVHADGGTGGRHSPLLSDGGMVGQRRPRDVYKMRLQIGVHNGAFCCSGTLMKRRKFNGGKRCRLAFHAVDRGSNPLGDANKRSSVERAFESKFCAFFLFDRLPFSKAFSAAAEQSGRGVLSPSRCVRGLKDPPPPNTFGGQALPVNVYPPVHGDTGLPPASCLAFPSSTDAPPNVPAGHVYASALHPTITPAISKVKKP